VQRVYRTVKDIELDGSNFIGDFNHQLVMVGCKGIIRNCNFSGGNTRLHGRALSVGGGYKSVFQYIDGGGVLIAGDSDIVFEDCNFTNNYSFMCGGAVSFQGRGKAVFRNCTFRNNISEHTGPAIDVLKPGNEVLIVGCKFIGNSVSRWGSAVRGQISVFPGNVLEIAESSFSRGRSVNDIDYHGDAKIIAEDSVMVVNLSNYSDTGRFRRAIEVAKATFIHPGTYPWV